MREGTLTKGAVGALAGIAVLVAASPAAAHVRRSDEPAPSLASPLALAAQQPAEPPATPTPRAQCGPGSRPEPGMQGRVPKEEVDSGRAKDGYWCNIDGGRPQRQHGRLPRPPLRRPGRPRVRVLRHDAAVPDQRAEPEPRADRRRRARHVRSRPSPVRTASLLTPAMQTPHESVNISVQRGILAAVHGQPDGVPGRNRPLRHQRGLPASRAAGGGVPGIALRPRERDGTGRPDLLPDLDRHRPHHRRSTSSNPRLPRTLWTGEYNTHGMSVSDDGKRGYLASGDGLIIVDLTEIQARKPNPQVREISRLTWSNMTIPQVREPRHDRAASRTSSRSTSTRPTSDGEVTGHGERVGAARIIDISDETKPAWSRTSASRSTSPRTATRSRATTARRAPSRATRRTTATSRGAPTRGSWPAR